MFHQFYDSLWSVNNLVNFEFIKFKTIYSLMRLINMQIMSKTKGMVLDTKLRARRLHRLYKMYYPRILHKYARRKGYSRPKFHKLMLHTNKMIDKRLIIKLKRSEKLKLRVKAKFGLKKVSNFYKYLKPRVEYVYRKPFKQMAEIDLNLLTDLKIKELSSGRSEAKKDAVVDVNSLAPRAKKRLFYCQVQKGLRLEREARGEKKSLN